MRGGVVDGLGAAVRDGVRGRCLPPDGRPGGTPSLLDDEAEAASRAIDHATGRQFGLVAAAETRTYVAEWDQVDGLWVAEIDDLMTATDLVVTVEGEAVASAGYELWPLNRTSEGRPWEFLRLEDATCAPIGDGPRTVQVTGWFGWVADPSAASPEVGTPRAIKTATKTLAARLFQRRNSPIGTQGSTELGGELRMDGPDKDIAKRLRPYWRLSESVGFA